MCALRRVLIKSSSRFAPTEAEIKKSGEQWIIIIKTGQNKDMNDFFQILKR